MGKRLNQRRKICLVSARGTYVSDSHKHARSVFTDLTARRFSHESEMPSRETTNLSRRAIFPSIAFYGRHVKSAGSFISSFREKKISLFGNAITVHRKNGRVSHRSCVSLRYFFRSIFHSPLYRRPFGSLSVTERVPRDTQPQRPGWQKRDREEEREREKRRRRCSTASLIGGIPF